MNKVHLVSRRGLDEEFGEGPALELGPGSTWGRVLDRIPVTKYTMVHGQSTKVGVGGFLLGGGINLAGTAQKIGNAASNVLEYTMVDSDGYIVKVFKELYYDEEWACNDIQNIFTYRSIATMPQSLIRRLVTSYRAFQITDTNIRTCIRHFSMQDPPMGSPLSFTTEYTMDQK